LIYTATGSVLLRYEPKWVFLLDIAGFIGFIPCIIAIWKQKRWGAYGATALYTIKMFESLWFYDIGNGFQILLYAIILWVLLASIWDYMD
jgi:hypothetical protein